ncbi:MAG: tetratricopeptide repeat protein [Candidatus Woesebacteria bacterium]
MTNIQQFTIQSINAAAAGDWEEAKRLNEKIIDLDPNNIGALNRLAYCEMQSGSVRKSKELYEKVLSLERFNPIATKYVALLKSKIKPQLLSNTLSGDFIEEPGKTRSVSLSKLADPAVLQSISTATPCLLIVKNHRVNVVTEQGATYLGCLPDDIAFRLQKMILADNKYSVCVQTTSKKSCIVFIKEIFKSPNSPFASSFPLSNQLRSSHQEDVLLDETPLDIRETGDEVDTHDFDEREPTE